MVNPLLIHSAIGLASLFIILKSADLIVFGISNWARKLGISEFLIGFLIVSIGTSLPETVSTLTGAAQGEGGLAVGTILGSNFTNLTLILGTLAILGKHIKTKTNIIRKKSLLVLGLVLLPLLLLVDGVLSRIDGAILLGAFAFYIVLLWRAEGEAGSLKKNVKLKIIWKDGLIFALALVALLLAARWLITSSLAVSNILGISPMIVGLTVIAFGTSFPELTVQARSILKKRSNLAIGNIMGSIVVNSVFVLGLTSIITPLAPSESILYPAIFMITAVVTGLYFMRKGDVNWKHGIVLIALYLIFLVSQFI